MAPKDGIRVLAEPVLASAGLRLWDVEVSRDLVRFLVDKDGGVDLDALSEASQVLSKVLDDNDELAPSGSYQLEVSSPGIERTLRTRDQYERYVGSTVTVKTVAPLAGARRHQGVLVAADDAGIRLAADEQAGEAPLTIAYDQIERARTVLEWGPGPKPGRPSVAGAKGPKRAKRSRRGTPSSPSHLTAGGAVPARKDFPK